MRKSRAKFQSTLPQEERPWPWVIPCQDYYFNPRSHKRSDLHERVILVHCLISIHAPTRGATEQRMKRTTEQVISIHAPTRGATGALLACLRLTFQFQSTLPQEERPGQMAALPATCIFQSTLPQEERPFSNSVSRI